MRLRQGPSLLAAAAALALGACQTTPSAAPARASAATAGAEASPLEGLDRAALRRRFGEPSLQRQEGEALVVAYRLDDCVLHLFLYPDETGEPLVRHAAAIGTDRRSRPVANCIP